MLPAQRSQGAREPSDEARAGEYGRGDRQLPELDADVEADDEEQEASRGRLVA